MAVNPGADLHRLKQIKKVKKASLTRLVNFFEDRDIEQKSVDEIRLKYERIDETWKAIYDALVDIAVLDPEMSDVLVDNEMAEYEDKVLNVKIAAERILRNKTGGNTDNGGSVYAEPGQQGRAGVAHGLNNGNNNYIRLPKIDLPTFSGTYEDWYPFFDIFNSLIHSNHSLSDIQRFHYLKSSLKGEAADAISSLEISSANYTDAWARLKERYDNKRIAVQNHIKAIFDLPSTRKENCIVLRQILDGVLKHTRALRALQRPTHEWDDILVHIITSKLDIATLKEWETNLVSSQLPSFQQLVDFLSRRCQTLEAVARRSQLGQINTILRQGNGNKVVASNAALIDTICICCNDSHPIYQCKTFQGLSIPERANQARKKGLCLNCLRNKHIAKDCSAGGCKICRKKHNTLLHIHRDSIKDSKEGTSPSQSQDANCIDGGNPDPVICNHSRAEETKVLSQVLLSTAVVKVRDHKNQWISGRALLDNGSQSNFITEEFAKQLGLKCRQLQVEIKGINQSVSRACKTVNLVLASRFHSFQMNLQCVVLPRITQNIPLVRLSRSEFSIPSNLRLADPQFYIPSKVDLLIGAERFWDLICVGQVRIHKKQPILQKSLLGWFLAGRMQGVKGTLLQTNCHLSQIECLNDTVNKFWRIENCLDQENPDIEEEHCIQFFKENHDRNKEGRFVVKLPIKVEILSQLGGSREIALKRLYALERKFVKMPKLKAEYVMFMREYLSLGHMKRIDEQDGTGTRIFLPHLAVIKDIGISTKTRVVFDASSKDSKGVALNDALYKGPTLQVNLFSLLLRFRWFRYVLSADIKKMYRQILVHDDCTPLQTILWRERSELPVEAFELLTVTYGTKPASFLAVKCLQQLAEYEKSKFPLAAKVVLNDFYMDDLLTGSDTESGLLQLKVDLSSLLALGGFELHKWNTNVRELFDDEICSENTSTILNDETSPKLLGVVWNSKEDSLHYITPTENCQGRVTKRVVLSEVSKLFDPLGLVGPVTTRAKILIQNLWTLKLNWDESVPINIHKEWLQIRSQLPALASVKIPRLVIPEGEGAQFQLHGFSDASEQAYGACIYVRQEKAIGEPSVLLLCAKSRVAPLKALSLPRLELCGAVLLVKLMQSVVSSLRVSVREKYYWTDSRIVLAWLNSPARKWQTFVANRVGEIQNSSSSSEWRHVKSKENPADLISRGATPERLHRSTIWWHGPEWLKLNKRQWPREEGELRSIEAPEM